MNFDQNIINKIQEYASNEDLGTLEKFSNMKINSPFSYISEMFSEVQRNIENLSSFYTDIDNAFIIYSNSDALTNIRSLSNETFYTINNNLYKNNIKEKIVELKEIIYNNWINLTNDKNNSDIDFSNTPELLEISKIQETLTKNQRLIINATKNLEQLRNNAKIVLKNFELLDKNSFLEKSKKLINDAKTNLNIIDKLTRESIQIINENKIYTLIEEEINKFEETFINPMKNTFERNEPKKSLSLAQKSSLISENKLNEILIFLKIKQENTNIKGKLILTKSQKCEEVILFEDDSLVFKNNDVYMTPNLNAYEYNETAKIIATDIVSFMLRKKPNFIALFNKKMIEEQYNLNGVLSTIDSFINNETLLKNSKVNPLKDFKDLTLEQIDDFIAKTKLNHQIKNYANSIISNKYKALYNGKSFRLFKELYELKISKEDLQDNIGQKIASFEDSEALNRALHRYLESLNGFSKDTLLDNIKGKNCNIVYEEDDMLILNVKDFNTSKSIGSASWCISRSENYFTSYVSTPNNYQFFIYDYNKPSTDKSSMIGITLYRDGRYSAAHFKNDDEIAESNKNFKIFQKIIIENNRDLFPNLDEKVKELIKETKLNNSLKM